MKRTVWCGAALAFLPVLLPAACGARELRNPVRLTLINRTGAPVTGVLLRFDRDLAAADRVSAQGPADLELRLAPADTLRISGGELLPGSAATYLVRGKDGPPRLLEGRWLIGGRLGRPLDRAEWRERSGD